MQIDVEDKECQLFCFDLIGLRNHRLHNKCWVNASLQGLKSCPAIRDHWYNVVLSRENVDVSGIPNKELKAFLEAYLGVQDYWMDQCKEKKMSLIRKDSADDCYETAEFPWHLEATRLQKFGNAVEKQINAIEDALDALVESLNLQNVIMKTSLVNGLDYSPYLRLHALKPRPAGNVDEGKYRLDTCQSNIVSNRVAVSPEYYKKDLNAEINLLIQNNELSYVDNGNVLIVIINTRVTVSDILIPTTEDKVTYDQLEYLDASRDGLRVLSKFEVTPLLTIGNNNFLLHGLIQHHRCHFVTFVNPIGNQKWFQMNDSIISAVQKQSLLTKQSMADPNVVGYFYQKLPESTSNRLETVQVPLFIKNDYVKRRPKRKIDKDNDSQVSKSKYD